MGLGIFIAKNLIENMKGNIHFYNSTNKGAVVEIKFEKVYFNIMNKKLIIVDDDTPFRERLTRSMEKKGFLVENFSSYNNCLNEML